MAISKIILNGVTQIDLTQDTVTTNNLITPNTAHGANGEAITGSASQGITPTGTLNITENGTYDVTNYASAVVSISSGGGSSATKHTIHFDFSDETDMDIDVYYDDAILGTIITAYTPVTYGQKTVTLAQLDGVTWYEPTNIPINTQLVDYNEVRTGYTIEQDGSIVSSDEWNCVTDYLPISNTMTFSFSCSQWAYMGFYDNNKNAIRTVTADEIKTSAVDYFASGTLDSSVIPPNAMYVVLRGNSYGIEQLSLIRTA